MPSGVKDIQLLELKDTISQLNKTISTQNELISSLQKMLEERNAKDSEKDLLIANLQSQLAYLKNKVFGSTSEIRHDQLDGQLNLFGTPVGDEKPAEVIEPEVISVKGYTKERKPKATYDDKYNSVRSICKHFFTDIVGLSIKFFCVSLRHMSISARIVVAVTFHEVDHAPDTEACTECDNECLKYAYCAVEKCHILFRNQRDLLSWAAAPVSGVPGFFPPFFSLSAAAMWVTCRDLFDRELGVCKKHCPFVPPSDIKKALCFETEGLCPWTLFGCQLTSSGFTTVYRSSGFRVSL